MTSTKDTLSDDAIIAQIRSWMPGAPPASLIWNETAVANELLRAALMWMDACSECVDNAGEREKLDAAFLLHVANVIAGPPMKYSGTAAASFDTRSALKGEA